MYEGGEIWIGLGIVVFYVVDVVDVVAVVVEVVVGSVVGMVEEMGFDLGFIVEGDWFVGFEVVIFELGWKLVEVYWE